GWYRRTPPDEVDRLAAKPDPNRIGVALRAFLSAAPALAATAADTTTRVLGMFYGSCLADTTGAVEGGVHDTLRADACLKLTQQYLEPALLNRLLKYGYPTTTASQVCGQTISCV
ncbi:MAG TPA: hypothetical protein VNL37_08955, partial [Candidatus Polarisedimenticolia bacterium]|nr:hypothetical protein [Candidatus Polarisedimenticolia bacterium]